LDTLSANPNVNEITVLAHSMGCVVTLEALRALHSRRFGDKVKNVLLVAPDVAVNDFQTEIQQLGRRRPRIALFISKDDGALKLSRTAFGLLLIITSIADAQSKKPSAVACDRYAQDYGQRASARGQMLGGAAKGSLLGLGIGAIAGASGVGAAVGAGVGLIG